MRALNRGLAIAAVEGADWVALVLHDGVPDTLEWDDGDLAVELGWSSRNPDHPWCIRLSDRVLDEVGWALDESMFDVGGAVQLMVLRAAELGFRVSVQGATGDALEHWLARTAESELVEHLGAARLGRLRGLVCNRTC